MANKKKDDSFTNNLIETTNDILDTKDSTTDYKKNDIKKNKGMALLAYVFVPIPLLFEKKSKFAKYHINQGFNLFICYIMYAFFYKLFYVLTSYETYCSRDGFKYKCGQFDIPIIVKLPFLVVGLILISLTILGIINVINGKAKQIPIIGKINILKKLYPKMKI